MQQRVTEAPATDLPALPDLSLVRARVTLRLVRDAVLPAAKGGLLRGGFGYAFQQAVCSPACRSGADPCAVTSGCPFRQVFTPTRDEASGPLHDLRDVPRPFVIEPPTDGRTHYTAGEPLEFGLVLIGQGADYLPYFLLGFEQLGRMGLGRDLAQARLERVEVLPPWQAVGAVIYQDGRAQVGGAGLGLPTMTTASVKTRAASLPPRLRLRFATPLRIKHRGDLMRRFEPVALVQAACWRLEALGSFYGDGGWTGSYQPLIAAAQAITLEQNTLHWQEWARRSTRNANPQTMQLGGLVGEAVLNHVPTDLRALLLLGGLVHVGKACVFGHGGYAVS
ncbi:MAG: CRISPR system precrRNA processing endoribonuclease RAMP protein Cas6 [Oscillochloridaceae bacterium umkhey_bin13]